MAIGTGISDGLGLGLNARAALVTRGWPRSPDSASGSAGDPRRSWSRGRRRPDLTATGDLSRNRKVGLALGQGKKLDAISPSSVMCRGLNTARAVERSAASTTSTCRSRPPCATSCSAASPARGVQELLARDPKGEA